MTNRKKLPNLDFLKYFYFSYVFMVNVFYKLLLFNDDLFRVWGVRPYKYKPIYCTLCNFTNEEEKETPNLYFFLYFYYSHFYFQEKRLFLNACFIFSFILACCTLRQCVFSSRYNHFVVHFNSYLITTPSFI